MPITGIGEGSGRCLIPGLSVLSHVVILRQLKRFLSFFFFHLFVFGFGLHGLLSILKFLFYFFSKNWSAVQTDSSLNALIVKLHFQKALPQVVSLRMRMENWTSRGDLASSRCDP